MQPRCTGITTQRQQYRNYRNIALNRVSTFIGLCEVEVSDSLLVQTDVPAHNYVILSLRLLQLLVIVGFQLHERPKDVLILVGIFVPDDDNRLSIFTVTTKHMHRDKRKAA